MRTPEALVSVILMTLAALGGVAAAGGQSAAATISGTAYTFGGSVLVSLNRRPRRSA